MNWLLTLIVSMMGGLAWAENLPCVSAYRADFVQLVTTNDLRYKETADLYTIYFDHVNGVAEYPTAAHRKMAELLKEKMEDGSGCNFLGWPRRKQFFRDQYAAKYSEDLKE